MQRPSDFTIHFFCIGAQKAGTSTFRDILAQHPAVFIPRHKEAHFTDVNENFNKGLDVLYKNHYSTYAGQKWIGNVNPNLQIETRSVDRIWQTFGVGTKLIFILRNPVERAYSHYLMSKKRGLEPLSFVNALEQESVRIKNPKSHLGYYSQELGHFEKNHQGYILRSTYAPMIRYMQERTDPSTLKLLLFENFITNQLDVINEVCRFLNINCFTELNAYTHSNEAQKPRSEWVAQIIHTGSKAKSLLKRLVPDEQTRKKIRTYILSKNLKPMRQEEKKIDAEIYNRVLQQYFIEDIEQTEKLTNFDLAQWKQHR